jgi:hypothetical protein
MARLPVGRSGVTLRSLTPWPNVPYPNKSIYLDNATLLFGYFSVHRLRPKLVSSSQNDNWAAWIMILFRRMLPVAPE